VHVLWVSEWSQVWRAMGCFIQKNDILAAFALSVSACGRVLPCCECTSAISFHDFAHDLLLEPYCYGKYGRLDSCIWREM
jgi:hypothetical protein